MSLVKIGGDTFHHWAVQSALQQTQGQHQMENCRYYGLQQGDALNRRGSLIFQAWTVRDQNQQQADNAAG